VAWDLEVSEGTRELTAFDLSGGGAKQLAARRVPVDEVSALDAALVASGHVVGSYDGHRTFVWRVTPDVVEVWSAAAKELEARDGMIVDSLGRRAPADSIAAIIGYVEDDFVDRGLKVIDRAGQRRTLCFELSPHASSDPTYSRSDLLSDSTWIPALGSALARWAGVPYRDEMMGG